MPLFDDLFRAHPSNIDKEMESRERNVRVGGACKVRGTFGVINKLLAKELQSLLSTFSNSHSKIEYNIYIMYYFIKLNKYLQHLSIYILEINLEICRLYIYCDFY